MDILYVLIRRELMVGPRRKGFWLRRSACIAVGGAIVLFTALRRSWSAGGTAGLSLVDSVSFVMLMVICIFAAPGAARAVHDDKQSQTLSIVALSDVSLLAALVGKFLSSFGVFLITVFSFLPLMALSVGLGGISFAQVFQILLISIATLFLTAGLGTFIGVLANTRNAMNALLLMSLVGVFVLPRMWFDSMLDVQHFISPFGALDAVLQGGHTGAILSYCGICLAFGLIFLLIAGLLLPRALLCGHAGPLIFRIPFLGRRIRSRKHRPIKEDPIFWLEMKHLRGGFWRVMLRFVLVACAVTGIITMSYLQYNQFSFEMVIGIIFSLVSIAWIIAFIGPISTAARSFDRDLSNKGFELVLLTGLRPRDFIFGKFRALTLAALPYVLSAALPVLGLTGLLVFLSALDDTGGAIVLLIFFCIPLIAFLVYIVSLWYCACVLGLSYSLRVGRGGYAVIPGFVLLYLILTPFLISSLCILPPFIVMIFLHIWIPQRVLVRMEDDFESCVLRRLERV